MPGRRVWRSLIGARGPAAAAEPGWLRALKLTRAAMVESAAVLIGLLLVALLVWEATRERVVIEPLSVPKELAEAGFTGEVIAQRLVAEIRDIQARARTSLERRAIGYASLDLEVPITVVGNQISPRALAGYLRSAACGWSSWTCRPQLRFSGDVTKLQGGYQIEMRLAGGEKLNVPSGTAAAPAVLDDLHPLIARAARSVVWRTDPYILASFVFQFDKPEAERLSRLILLDKSAGSVAQIRAINLIGLVRHAANDLDAAEASYRRAIELDPQFAIAHSNLGNVLFDRGDLDAAIASHRRAVAIDPIYAVAHSNLGNGLRAKRDLAGAVASYRRALELDPTNAVMHSNLGVALREMGDLAGAMASYRRGIELDPGYAAGHYNLGLALHWGGDLDGAVESYRRAAELRPDNPTFRRALDDALAELGRGGDRAGTR